MELHGREAFGPVPLRTGPQGCVLSFSQTPQPTMEHFFRVRAKSDSIPAFKLLQSSRSDKTCICPKMPRHGSYPDLSVAFMSVTKGSEEGEMAGWQWEGLLTWRSPWASQCSQCFAYSHSFNPHSYAATLQKTGRERLMMFPRAQNW